MTRFNVYGFILVWIIALFIVLMLQGCEVINTRVAPKIADGVKRYCLTPSYDRHLLREQVNAMIAPNAIRVTCEGDSPNE